MAEALYRKYRPLSFEDIVGQEHIEHTLKNAIEKGKVSHAYLFCGPRGTGKTTTARILAKALLCEKGPCANPDGTCPECVAIAQGSHPDVYELDAASRTGVENVREEIISRVHYAPTRGQVKIYIIDEVHMLSVPAFNALLKTLEEPPAHVMFILCTTDPHKVPETIHSRCQRFDFHRIAPEQIIARLGYVCGVEGVEYDPEALDLIARRAEGGMRNALTYLEQLIAFGDGRVSYEGAQSLLGGMDNTDMHDIVLAIGRRDVSKCFSWTAQYVEEGSDLAQFTRDLAEHIRTLYLMSVVRTIDELDINPSVAAQMKEELSFFNPDRLSRMLMVLDDLIKELRFSSNARLSFEIALTRLVRPDSDLTLESLAERVASLEKQLAQILAKGIALDSSAERPPAQSEPPVARAVSAPASIAVPASNQGSAVAPVPAYAQPESVTSQLTSSFSAPSVPAEPVAQQVAPQGTSSFAPQEVSSSAVDVSNPAALQRLWRAVTTTLRKTDPTCGVLFMNAKVSPNLSGQGILIEFSSDSEFAYNAASKEKSQSLLAKTLDECAHGHLPYQLVLSGSSQNTPRQRVAAAVSTYSQNSAAPTAFEPTTPAPLNQSAPSPTAQDTPSPAATQIPTNQVSATPSVPTMPVSQAVASMPPSQTTVVPTMPANKAASSSSAAQTVSAQAAPAPTPSKIQGTASYPAFSNDYSLDEQVPLSAYDSYESFSSYSPEPTDAPSAASAGRSSWPVEESKPSANQATNLPNAQKQTGGDSSIQNITDLEALLSEGFGEGITFKEI